jgi:hypothetical protein
MPSNLVIEINEINKKIRELNKQIISLESKRSVLSHRKNIKIEKMGFNYLGIEEGTVIIPKTGECKDKEFKVENVSVRINKEHDLYIARISGHIKTKAGDWEKKFSHVYSVVDKEDFTVVLEKG